jgi:hypothetical protein
LLIVQAGLTEEVGAVPKVAKERPNSWACVRPQEPCQRVSQVSEDMEILSKGEPATTHPLSILAHPFNFTSVARHEIRARHLLLDLQQFVVIFFAVFFVSFVFLLKEIAKIERIS